MAEWAKKLTGGVSWVSSVCHRKRYVDRRGVGVGGGGGRGGTVTDTVYR